MNVKHHLESLLAYIDEAGNVYGIAEEGADCANIVPLFPNPTWEPSDYTDKAGKNWIKADRLGQIFTALVEGIPAEHICSTCRIGRAKLRQYLSGERAIPEEIWQTVEAIKRDKPQEKDPDFATALKKAKLTKRAASVKFEVCYNTIQNWASGRSRLPKHVRAWTERTLSK